MKAHVYFGTAFEELAQYGVLSIDSCLWMGREREL
jgi:hypothetical protein